MNLSISFSLNLKRTCQIKIFPFPTADLYQSYCITESNYFIYFHSAIKRNKKLDGKNLKKIANNWNDRMTQNYNIHDC